MVQMKLLASSFLVLFWLGFCVSDYCGPWVPIDWSTLPKSNPTDRVEVWYLVAPLLACSYVDDFAPLGAFHSGIGFVNNASKWSFTINFDAYPTFTGVFLPNITQYPNGTYDITWQNFGALFIYDGINTTYWEQRVLVATMTGDGLNKIIPWFPTTNETFMYYNPWSVYDHWPGTLLLGPFECFTFSWVVFIEIQKLGGKFIPDAVAKQTIFALYSGTTPQVVNTSDPNQWAMLLDFYLTVEEKISNEGIYQFILDLWEILVDGYFFLRKDDVYYFIDLHDFPYFGVHYIPVPLPNNTFPDSSQTIPFKPSQTTLLRPPQTAPLKPSQTSSLKRSRLDKIPSTK